MIDRAAANPEHPAKGAAATSHLRITVAKKSWKGGGQ